MWPLLCWGIVLLYLICWEFLLLKGIEFCQRLFFCIYWDDHMIFAFPSVNVVYHVYWFAYVEPSLHSRDKTHLIMVYNLLMCCWIQFASILLRIFAFMFIRDVGLQFSFLFVSLYDFGVRVILALFPFLRRLLKGLVNFSLNVW